MKKCKQISFKISGIDRIACPSKKSSLDVSVRRNEVSFFIPNNGWLHISAKGASRLRNHLLKAIKEIKRREKMNI